MVRRGNPFALGSDQNPVRARRVRGPSPFARGRNRWLQEQRDPFRAGATISHGGVLATQVRVHMHFRHKDRSPELIRRINKSVERALDKMGAFVRRTAKQQIRRRNALDKRQMRRIMNKNLPTDTRVTVAKALGKKIQKYGTSSAGRPPFAHARGNSGLKAIKYENAMKSGRGNHVDILYVPYPRKTRAGASLEQTDVRGRRLKSKKEDRDFFYKSGRPITVRGMRPNLKMALQRNIPKIRLEFQKIARR